MSMVTVAGRAQLRRHFTENYREMAGPVTARPSLRRRAAGLKHASVA
ncbi:MAG: hypothetical protein MZV70_34985 [Desulfobacterales bacterium]|nr:hypothetical protein [Desulfobacterales bacterium]